MKTFQDWTQETGFTLNDDYVPQENRPQTYDQARQLFIQTGGSSLKPSFIRFRGPHAPRV